MKSIIVIMFIVMMTTYSAFGVYVIKDPDFTSSIMINDFNNSAVSTNMVVHRMVPDSCGQAGFIYEPGEGPDGYVYIDGSTVYDPDMYSSIRARMYTTRTGGAGGDIDVYPYPAVDNNGRVKLYITGRTEFYEASWDFSSVTPTQPFNGWGVRIDPFNYTNDENEDTCTFDYIMADLGQSRGAEFGCHADLNRFDMPNVTGASIANGILSGTAINADPQIDLYTGIGINADIYDSVEIRVKGVAGSAIKYFWQGTVGSIHTVVVEEGAAVDGNWHTYLLDMRDESEWTGMLDYNRLDPVEATGDFFQVDYVRFLSYMVKSSPEYPRFTLWQLPSQGTSQMNSYVIKSSGGKIIVIDGGMTVDGSYLKSFLASLGNHVDCWFITHVHPDHIDALTWILSNLGTLEIDSIYASFPPTAWLQQYVPSAVALLNTFNTALGNTSVGYVDIDAGDIFHIDEIDVEVLSVENTDITVNAMNNSSVVMRFCDATKSILFTGDMGVEAGDKLLGAIDPLRLKANYAQMAHHGQAGPDEDFYEVVDPDYCLWPTPLWLWNNDNGGGYDSGPWETLDTRQWMSDLGVPSSNHYVSGFGLIQID